MLGVEVGVVPSTCFRVRVVGLFVDEDEVRVRVHQRPLELGDVVEGLVPTAVVTENRFNDAAVDAPVQDEAVVVPEALLRAHACGRARYCAGAARRRERRRRRGGAADALDVCLQFTDDRSTSGTLPLCFTSETTDDSDTPWTCVEINQ